MNDDAAAAPQISVTLERTAHAQFVVRNTRGQEITIGEGSNADFTPVELLLAAIASCSAIDVDYLTTKRAEPDTFLVQASGRKLPEHLMTDLRVGFDVEFADDETGRAARSRVPSAVQISHDRLCTVSRTVEQGVPVQLNLEP